MTVLAAGAPTRAPGVELLGEMAGSGYREAPGLVRRADGQTIQVTPLLYRLLESVDGARGIEELAVALGDRTGKHVEQEDVRYLLEEKLAPLGLLAGEGEPTPSQKQSPLLGLKLKVVVSDPEATRRITGPFARLFSPWIVLPTLALFGVTCWWVLWRKGLASATRQAFDSPGLLVGVFVLTILSAGWHEFGHAAACRAKGATPGAMGAGLYLVWPAFYTDVDDCYRLNRWGRLVVDLGGLYFNTLVAVAVTGAWVVTRIDALLLVVATQLLLMLRQLAPIVRADGYHILSDLTGVPDLFQHLKPTLLGLLPTHWGRPQPLRPWARWVVRAWVIVVVPLLLSMMATAVLLLPRLIATAWQGLQLQGDRMAESGSDGDVLSLMAAILRLLALVLPAAAVLYQVVRMGRRGIRWVAAKTKGRPAARGAAVLAGIALLGLLLAAWWPAGQYQPVHATERGTLSSALKPRAVRAQATRPIAGTRPRTAYALVPRDRRSPSLLVMKGDDGQLQSVVTDGGDARSGRVLPFSLPEAPGPGDNQALAVNTTDGAVVYDVAVALVWMTEGDPAMNRNDAYALASCTGCTTVAVAFQVVLIVGQTNAVAPINVAVAANGGCVSCVTTALAVQLVVTLQEMPTDEVRAQIEAAMARVADLEDLPDPLAEITAVEQEILTILVDNGLVAPGSGVLVTTEQDGPTATTSTSTRAVTNTSTSLGGATSTSRADATTTTTSRSTTTSSTSTSTSTTVSTTVTSDAASTPTTTE